MLQASRQSRLRAALLAAVLLTLIPYPPSFADTVEGTGHFTVYYKPVVEGSEGGGGIKVEIETVDGEKRTRFISRPTSRLAEMQGSVLARTKDGQLSSFTRVGKGIWRELGPGWWGWGNRENPLYPFRIVAADQTKHRYGSKIYVEALDGFPLPDNTKHDGYFWIGDTGGRIKGHLRFDIFVGAEEGYQHMLKEHKGKQDVPVILYPIPSSPKGLSIYENDGVKKVLEGLGVESPVRY